MISAIENQLSLKKVQVLRPSLLDSDSGKLFVKYGEKDLVLGELESLKAIQETGSILCPKPFGIVENHDTHCLITSFIDFQHEKDWKMAGNQIGRMHRKNAENLEEYTKNEKFVGKRRRFKTMTSSGSESDYDDDDVEFVEKFGFKVPTCCGRLPQNNEWIDSWAEFFIRNRLKPQIDRILETHSPRCLLDNANALYRTAESLLKCRCHVAPSLVHGDLWSGNWSMAKDTNGDTIVPIVFDPSSSFSDPEFEFGIMRMFGGWTKEFEEEYEKIMGVAREGKEQRVALYELYHHLNHWNHFGGSYQQSSMALINRIIGKI